MSPLPPPAVGNECPLIHETAPPRLLRASPGRTDAVPRPSYRRPPPTPRQGHRAQHAPIDLVYVVIKVGRRATKVGPACHKGWVPVPAACPHALLPYAVSLIHPSQGPLRRHDPLLTLYSHHARRPILRGKRGESHSQVRPTFMTTYTHPPSPVGITCPLIHQTAVAVSDTVPDKLAILLYNLYRLCYNDGVRDETDPDRGRSNGGTT